MMPQKRAIWTARMIELLADGEWHDRTELLTVGAKAVPPGRAARQAEKNRVKLNRSNGDRVRPVADEQLIAFGARDIARRSLEQQVRSGKVEQICDEFRIVR